MGHSPHAVLAYGYDITRDLAHYGEGIPAWVTDDSESDYANAVRALCAAAAEDITHEAADGLSVEEIQQICGVTLVRLGYDDPRVLLAARHHDTDWDTNKVIPHFELPDDTDERLKRALAVLAIDPGERLPEWILAAWMPA